MSVTTINH